MRIRTSGDDSSRMLFDRRLIFVTGKGGVGKTTVSAALGLAAAHRGKRTILCEVQTQERMSSLLGREGSVGHEETEITENLWSISIDPNRAVEEYMRHALRSRTLYKILIENRIFQYMFAAAPGTRELVTIGRLWELAQLERKWIPGTAPYDLVIVDAPATGHGLGMLAAPRTFRDIARVGPIAGQADQIDAFFQDPTQTAIALVALPEEIPVNEALEFQERVGRPVDLTVVNALYPQRFSAKEAAQLDGEQPAIRAARSEHLRARSQRNQLARLKRGSSSPVTTLPYLFHPELHLHDVESLSDQLDDHL